MQAQIRQTNLKQNKQNIHFEPDINLEQIYGNIEIWFLESQPGKKCIYAMSIFVHVIEN